MTETPNFIIDFDSTFTKVEALDILAEITAEKDPSIKQKIEELTIRGMNGELSFRDSLTERMALLVFNDKDLEKLVERLRGLVSESFKRNREFFNGNSDKIYIISSGFKDFIAPIVTEYGVKEEHIFANQFLYDGDRNVIGFDHDNVLSMDGGKVKLMKSLNLQGDVFVIGDGYTDYEIRQAGLANKFYAFTENIEREKVIHVADDVTPSLDEILFQHKLNTALSYPKNRIKVLLLENIHVNALEKLKDEGYQVELIAGALTEDELCEKIKDVSVLGIRSKTHLTPKALAAAKRLIAVGAFCIGTNQIDLEGCQKRGIAVFNAPFSNTRSVVELAIGQMIMLMRKIPQYNVGMHKGIWNKSANNSFEVRGKKLGIVGYGNIGSQLSVLAESMGIQVYYFDLEEKLALGNATAVSSLEELFNIVDVVSLHVDGRPENDGFINATCFDQMKDGVVFINLSRGKVVDIAALKANLESGKILGAAIDVFPKEPKTNQDPFISELIGFDNLILTPHIGGSTQEAQENIANFVPGKIMQYINTGSTMHSVNFPNVQLPGFKNAHRLMHIHQNNPGILAKINIIFADHKINVLGQHLKTNENIGYVITDIDKKYDQVIIESLKSIPGTIWFRALY